jgi:hypothetical protein
MLAFVVYSASQILMDLENKTAEKQQIKSKPTQMQQGLFFLCLRKGAS